MDYKFTCSKCNYYTNKSSDFVKHHKTRKHLNNNNNIIVVKENICDICDIQFLNHWNYKIHMITNHASIEEKRKYKYYCEYCNIVLFCSLYYDKHISSKKHKTNVLATTINNLS